MTVLLCRYALHVHAAHYNMLVSQFAEQWDYPKVVQLETFMQRHDEMRHPRYKDFAKRVMHASGRKNRKKVPKCMSRLTRQLWSSDRYTDHKDASGEVDADD